MYRRVRKLAIIVALFTVAVLGMGLLSLASIYGKQREPCVPACGEICDIFCQEVGSGCKGVVELESTACSITCFNGYYWTCFSPP